MQSSNRQRPALARLPLLVTLALVAAGVFVAGLVFVRVHAHLTPDRNFNSGGFLEVNLPFTIPCATSSEDAGPVYVALRARDRKALRDLLSQERMLAVQKGSPVRMSRFGQVVGVKVESGPRTGVICFVPPDIVPVIRQHVSQTAKPAQLKQ